jgi:regulator of protease activity HflC (stomatin/prohibitin superfamily)
MAVPHEKALAFLALLSAAALGLDLGLHRASGLPVLGPLPAYAAFASLLCAVAWIRALLARRADDEERDAALARAERPDASLFGSGEAEPFSAARSRAEFDRVVSPAVPPLAAAGLGAWCWQLFQGLAAPSAPPRLALFACAAAAAQAFFLFLGARYLLGLSRDARFRSARAPALALGLSSVASLIGAAGAGAGELVHPAADRVAAYALAGGLGLLSAELLLNVVAALYASRRADRLLLAAESRLGALLTDPAAWARSIAQTLDYQFGYKVSETWFYRFASRALAPVLIFQLLTLYLMSCLVFLAPGEEAVLERFGRPRAEGWHLKSGPHLKWPWPFETVRRVDAGRVQVVHAGYEPEADRPPERVLLWTVPHYRDEDRFLVAGGGGPAGDTAPAGFLALALAIEYRVTNVAVHAYGVANPAAALKQVATRALTRAAAVRPASYFFGAGRSEATAALRADVQSEADRLGLGVEVLFAGLHGVHPPVQVAAAYQSVVGALEEREATLLKARAYTNSLLPRAEADAAMVRSEAEAYKVRRGELAQAEAQRFEKRLDAARRAPEVYRKDLYLRALSGSLAGARKYVVDAPGCEEVLYFNFQEKPYPDLFDLVPVDAEEKQP